MDLYFTDRSFNLLGIASTSSQSQIQVSADVDDEIAPNSVGRSYTATLNFANSDIHKVKEMAALGNFVLYKDYRERYTFMTIMEWTRFEPWAGTLTFVAENGGIDLINETVGPYTATKAMPIADYINQFTADSGFEIGTNEISNQTRTLKWEGDSDTSLARIESVATQFDAELDFRFDVSGTAVIKRYIDIYKRVGADKGQRLEVNTHLNKITTTGNIYDLYTSVVATGGTPEGSETPITLAGYKWTDPDGRYVLTSTGLLLDTVANQKWSRLGVGGAVTNVKGGYINRVITYTATNQAELFQSALAGLKAATEPVLNYDVDIVDLPRSVNVGDTVHAVDELQDLNLSTRLLELKTSYADDTRTATLGDFLIEANQIDPQYRVLAEELAKQNKGKDGVGLESSVVTYQAGTSGTTAPTGTWSEAIPAVSPSQFLWSRTVLTMTDGSTSTTYSVGKIGDTGKPGNGIQSSIVTYQVGTSGTTAPTGTWSSTVPTVSQGAYLWSRIITTYTDGTQNTAYSVAYQAKDGADGTPGSQDVPMTYVQTAQPTGKIVKDSTWWVGDSMKTATALKRWNGSDWVPDTIAQTVLNILELNAITVNGSMFNGSTFNSTFANVQPIGFAQTVSGTSTLADGALVTDVYQNGTSTKISHNEFNQLGVVTQQYVGEKVGMQALIGQGQLDLGGYFAPLAGGDPVWNESTLSARTLYLLNNTGTPIWNGVNLMGSNQLITPNVLLENTLVGWVFQWSQYDTVANKSIDKNWTYCLVPKAHNIGHDPIIGWSVEMPMVIPNKGNFTKIVWVANNAIGGDSSGTTGLQVNACLRAIYAV